MAVGKRGKKLGIQLRDEQGRTYWAKDGSGNTLTFPNTKEGRKDAELVERELVLERDKRRRRPELLRTGEITIADYYERWRETHERPKDSTNIQYKHALKPFIELFGHRPMRSIQRSEAVDFAAEHPWRVNAVRAMFNDAMDEEVVDSNHFDKLPKNQRGHGGRKRRIERDSMIILSPKEIDRLAATAIEVHGDSYGPIFAARIIVAAYSGLRPGELNALKWEDIDFDRKRIIVREQRSAATGEYTSTKTVKPGRRNAAYPEIGLLEPAEDALKRLPALIDRHFLGEPPETDRIFPTIKGKAFSSRLNGYYWHPVRAVFGSPHMDFYELRHTCATWLREMGFPSYIIALQLQQQDGGRLVEKVYGKPDRDAALDRLVNEAKFPRTKALGRKRKRRAA